jgi:hypothetical protein
MLGRTFGLVEDERRNPVWAVTTDRTRFVDAASVRERLEQWHRDDRPFHPISDVIGIEAAEELAGEFVRAVLARAAVPEARFADLAALTKLNCMPNGDAWVLKVEC